MTPGVQVSAGIPLYVCTYVHGGDIYTPAVTWTPVDTCGHLANWWTPAATGESPHD